MTSRQTSCPSLEVPHWQNPDNGRIASAKGGLRCLCVILILQLVTIGQAKLNYHHHQPYRWILRDLASDRVIKENVTVGAPTFTITNFDLFSRVGEPKSLWGTYWGPSSNPGKSYCNYPGYYFCGYWGCETIVTSDRWKPEKDDEFLRVRWGPNKCKHPKFARDGLLAERGTCSHLILEIQNPANMGWMIGKTWSVFIHHGLKDPGTVIQIIRTMPQTPQAVGPNPVLNPRTSKPLISNTKNNTEDAAPNDTETLNTLEFEMPPLRKLLNSTYQILNSTNPNITTNCCLCYDIRPPFYEAIGVPSDPELVDGSNPTQCVWNTVSNPGITMQYVSGQGTCVGDIPLEKRRLCTNKTTLKRGSKSDWLVPAKNTKWVCSKTGVTPCTSLKQLTKSNESCIQAIIIPRIIYHPEEFVYNYQTLLTSHHIQKREPLTALTIATLLAIGTAGAGTGIASLVKQNQKFHSLRITVDKDLARIEQSISALEASLRSLSEVVLQNRRGLDLCFYNEVECVLH